MTNISVKQPLIFTRPDLMPTAVEFALFAWLTSPPAKSFSKS